VITVVIPFWNGREHLQGLLPSLPPELQVIVVDDWSDRPFLQSDTDRANTIVTRPERRGYFAGAVNHGIKSCDTDVLVLNQDLKFKSDGWLQKLLRMRDDYALIGDGVMGHPAWPDGYVQGTFMFMRRDAIDAVGLLNTEEYPLWGCTAEWQLRAYRQGFRFHASRDWRQFFLHRREGRGQRFGKSINLALKREPGKHRLFIQTPPKISVIVPCYNYGHYLQDCIGCLVGGKTCLGKMPGQTFQSFEIIIVDDCSTDGSFEIAKSFEDRSAGIRVYQTPENLGTAGCINYGIDKAFGDFIHILSADDMRESFCLEALYSAIKDEPMSFAFGDIRILKDGKRGRRMRLPEFDPSKIASKNTVPAGIMYPKEAWEIVGGYPQIMRHGREDWAFNVGLALNGYCGIHIGDSGNLYRRESQNRSLKTGNIHKDEVPEEARNFDWSRHFREQIYWLYPNAKERLGNMCCGRTSGSRSNRPSVKQHKPKPLVGRNGFERLEFTGKNAGTRTFYCSSGNRYRFGNNQLNKRGYVALEDVDQLLETGFFRVYSEEPDNAPRPPEEIVEEIMGGNGAGEDEARPEAGADEADETELPRLTGAAKRVASRLDLTESQLAEIEPSGATGKILKSDVTRFAEGLA